MERPRFRGKAIFIRKIDSSAKIGFMNGKSGHAASLLLLLTSAVSADIKFIDDPQIFSFIGT
jgi:hypothetical protein